MDDLVGNIHEGPITGPGKAYATLAELWDEDVSYMEGRDFERPAGFVLQ